MTKTEKQLDKALRKALTIACENIKDQCTGFSHLTHAVNLKKIHDSLHVSCFFIDELSLSEATEQQQLPAIENEIKAELSAINIKSPTISF